MFNLKILEPSWLNFQEVWMSCREDLIQLVESLLIMSFISFFHCGLLSSNGISKPLPIDRAKFFVSHGLISIAPSFNSEALPVNSDSNSGAFLSSEQTMNSWHVKFIPSLRELTTNRSASELSARYWEKSRS